MKTLEDLHQTKYRRDRRHTTQRFSMPVGARPERLQRVTTERRISLRGSPAGVEGEWRQRQGRLKGAAKLAAVFTTDTSGWRCVMSTEPNTMQRIDAGLESIDWDLAAAMALILWPRDMQLATVFWSPKMWPTASHENLPTLYRRAIAPKLGLPLTRAGVLALVDAARRFLDEAETPAIETRQAAPPVEEVSPAVGRTRT